MITIIGYNNWGAFDELYRDQFRLRHREFIERQKYDVKTYHGMEFDEYDTPASVYLVYSEDGQTALGVSRLMPTTVRCMLAEHWPHIVSSPADVISLSIWEGTRFCVDSTLAPALRKKIAQEICAAYLEFGLSIGIKKIIGVMQTMILKSVFANSGILYEKIGDANKIGNHNRVQAAMMHVSWQQLEKMRRTTGLQSSVVNNLEVNSQHIGYKNAA